MLEASPFKNTKTTETWPPRIDKGHEIVEEPGEEDDLDNMLDILDWDILEHHPDKTPYEQRGNSSRGNPSNAQTPTT